MTRGSKRRNSRGAEDDKKRAARHLDELLDEALKETFPASDPPAVIQPPAKDS